MTEISVGEQSRMDQAMIKEEENLKRRLSPVVSLSKPNRSSLVVKLMRLLFTFVFTYVYFVFSIVYVFKYKDILYEIFSATGSISLFYSQEFWLFQRDLVFITIGYLLLHVVLCKLMYIIKLD
jgi:hypothetical protein